MHEKAIIKYRFLEEIPFRARVLSNYENITDVEFVAVGEERLMVSSVDHKTVLLVKMM
jgi:hypothetical protein